MTSTGFVPVDIIVVTASGCVPVSIIGKTAMPYVFVVLQPHAYGIPVRRMPRNLRVKQQITIFQWF